MKWAVVSRRWTDTQSKERPLPVRPPPEVRLFRTFESAAKYARGKIKAYLKNNKTHYESWEDFITKNYDHEGDWRGISRFETNEGEFFIEKVKLEPQEVGK